MSSPPRSPANDSVGSYGSPGAEEQAGVDDTVTVSDVMRRQARAREDASEDQDSHQYSGTSSPSPPPADVPPFDWEDFEARYEKALQEADEEHKGIIKEAEALAKYFKVWASAASAHDDDRAVKRLRTRQRFVNLSEEKMAQKQKHYEEVVRAFESALALLKSS